MSQTIENRVRIYFHAVVYISICFILCLPTNTWALSDKRLCADEKCEKIISIGTGALNYRAPAADMVSFQINSPIRVMSKSAGSDLRFWGVEVKGRRGYVDKKFVKETKVYIRDKDLFEVDVEAKPKPVDVSTPAVEQTILNASETVEIKSETRQADTASTTTSPLGVNVKVDQQVINTESTDSNVKEPVQTTPVRQNIEVVDGTKIPIEEITPIDESNEQAKQVNETQKNNVEDNNENEDFDYEEDDEEGNVSDTDDNDKLFEQYENDLPNVEPESKEISKEKIADVKSEKENVPENGVEQKKVNDLKENSTKQVKNVDNDTTKIKNSTTESLNIEYSIEQTKDTLVKEKSNVVEEKQTEKLVSNPNDSAAKDGLGLLTEQMTINEEVAPKHTVEQLTTPRATISAEHVVPTQTTQPTLKQEVIVTPVEPTVVPSQAKQNITDNVDTKNEIEKNEESAVLSEEKKNVTETEFHKSNTLPLVPALNLANETEDTSASPTTNQPPFVIDHQTETQVLKEKVTEKPNQPNSNIQTSVNYQQTETQVLKEDVKEQPIKEIPLSVDPQANEITTAIPPINVPASLIQPYVNTQTPVKDQAETQMSKGEVKEQAVQEIPLPADPQTNEVTTAVPPLNVPASLSSLPPLFRQTTLSSSAAETAEQTNPIANDHYKKMEQGNNIHSTTQSVEAAESLLPHITDPHDEYGTTSSYQQLNSLENEETTLSPPLSEFNHNVDNEKGNIDNGNELGSDEDADTADAILGIGSVETIETFKPPSADPLALPSTSAPSSSSSLDNAEPVNEGDGLFATILGTVNSFLSNNGKIETHSGGEEFAEKQDLDGILYPDRIRTSKINEETCVKGETSSNHLPFMSLDNFVELLAVKLLENSQLLLCMAVAAAASLFFLFGYYCFCNSSNERELLEKLNMLERTLLATHKENSIMKHDLMATRNKLSSIEDNSFGSNDMVISLRKQLEEELVEKAKLHEQVKNLEKDLVSAADAGLELNKYVSELLANQNGDESIKDTIEELQRQLNEQDHTIKEINASLAEKSRENSELQFSLAEQNARLSSDLKILQQDNDELEAEKTHLQTQIGQLTTEFEKNLSQALESKNIEMQRLQKHILDINSKREREHSDLQTSLAKIEALEDCLRSLKKGANTNVEELINAAKLRGELTALQKKYSTLKTQLNNELESKSLTENQLKTISNEIEKLKKEYNQSEKDKLDAQTRLDVLSTYFKEKEAQLQKELNVKEAMWLKQQGENTGTVDKITGMQEEIQTLKSQNEELRAEIEAQVASHKAQTGILQNRVHEHYLAARQAERRYDEARNESAILRSQLTALATNGNSGEQGANAGVLDNTNKSDNKDAPSPLPGSPFFPPPLPFLPPQAFLGPSHGYMGLPAPPPFLPPPEDLRPAPLGRMRSPTTRSGRYSPSEAPRRPGRYSPNDDYSDYDDDYYDDDYDDRIPHRRRRSWQRESYSPPPRTYRSLSPAESRFNCADPETDYSPPASPRSDRVPARPINEV